MKPVYEYHFTRKRVAEVPATVRDAGDIAQVIGRELLEGEEAESLLVVLLDTRNHVIGIERVYQGSVNVTQARIGELFRSAVRLNAAGLVLVHNHPSGDPTPSPDDLYLTAEAIQAGRILDIEVLDHVVVGSDGAFVSLRDRGVNFDRQPKEKAA